MDWTFLQHLEIKDFEKASKDTISNENTDIIKLLNTFIFDQSMIKGVKEASFHELKDLVQVLDLLARVNWEEKAN